MAHDTSIALFEEKMLTMELLLENGVSEKDAASAVGMSKSTLARYKTDPVLLDRIERAKYRSKGDLIATIHKIGTKGQKVREVVVTEEPVLQPDGSFQMSVTKKTTIDKEVPADYRAAMALLKARFPEDFGNINRLDMRKIGSAGQVDQDRDPNIIEDPKRQLEMILNGNGIYEALDDEIDTMPEPVPIQTLDDEEDSF